MKKFKQLFMLGAKYCGKCKGLYITTFLTYFGQTFLGLFLPVLEAKIIDSIVYAKDIQLVAYYSLITLAVYSAERLLIYWYMIAYAKLQTKTGNMYFLDMNIFLHNTSMKYLSSFDSAYMMNRVNSACNFTPILFIFTTLNLVQIFIKLIFAFVMILKNSYLIAALTVVTMILEVIAYFTTKDKLYKVKKANQENNAEFQANKMEQYKDSKFIKTHGVDEIYNSKFENGYLEAIRLFTIQMKWEKFYDFIPVFLEQLMKTIIYIACGYAVINGNMTMGIVTLIIQYFTVANSASKEFYDLGSTYQAFLASFDKIEEFKKAYSHKDGEKMPEHIDNITVENLNFDYGDKPIYRNYNLELEKGKIYGLKGDNGAGKSTLLNIMLGLYMGDYTGEICYNGVDINDINLTKCKQKLIGVTEQEPLLMKDTLYNNICLTEKYSKEDIYKYAEMIGLKPYLDKLPEGLETEINDQSTNISGGEKQKISILRQLLKNPDVMIFDEPTSALDIESAKLFLQHIQKIKDDKIIIMISHDENAQKIYDETIYIKKCAPTLEMA